MSSPIHIILFDSCVKYHHNYCVNYWVMAKNVFREVTVTLTFDHHNLDHPRVLVQVDICAKSEEIPTSCFWDKNGTDRLTDKQKHNAHGCRLCRRINKPSFFFPYSVPVISSTACDRKCTNIEKRVTRADNSQHLRPWGLYTNKCASEQHTPFCSQCQQMKKKKEWVWITGFWVIEENKYVLQVTSVLRDSVCISRQIWQTVSPPTVCTANGAVSLSPTRGSSERTRTQATKEKVLSTENTGCSLISMMSVV